MIEHLPDLPVDHAWTVITGARHQAFIVCVAVQLVLCLIFAAWLTSDNARTAATYEQVMAACSAVVNK